MNFFIYRLKLKCLAPIYGSSQKIKLFWMGGDMETQLPGTSTFLIVGFLALLFITIGVVLIILHRRN